MGSNLGRVLEGNPASGGAGSTITAQRLQNGSGDVTTNSSVFVDILGMSMTMPNRANGKAIITFGILWSISTAQTLTEFRLVDGAGNILPVDIATIGGSQRMYTTLSTTVSLSGQIVKLQAQQGFGATITIWGTANGYGSSMSSLEISSP